MDLKWRQKGVHILCNDKIEPAMPLTWKRRADIIYSCVNVGKVFLLDLVESAGIDVSRHQKWMLYYLSKGTRDNTKTSPQIQNSMGLYLLRNIDNKLHYLIIGICIMDAKTDGGQ